MAGLIGAAWLELRANGYARISGTVSAPMLRLFRRLGFLVTVIGPEVHTFGEIRYPIVFEPTAEAASAAGAAARRSP
jgi:N-acyl-L-homoserine lactone synthetase